METKTFNVKKLMLEQKCTGIEDRMIIFAQVKGYKNFKAAHTGV